MTKRTALITGASQGIGAATAKALAADGYHVIVHYGANRERAEKVAAEIRAGGGSTETIGADLALPDAPRQIAGALACQLHALVLNAAVMPGDSTIPDCTPETFDRIFAVNLRAPFFLLQQLSPVLAEGASVIMVSSVTARRAIGAVDAYGVMKAAIEALVGRAAGELGERGIRVNAVAPATTETETVAPWLQSEAARSATMATQALKRIGQPEDIADVIAFLCSEKARWVTGAVIPVDGGTLL